MTFDPGSLTSCSCWLRCVLSATRAALRAAVCWPACRASCSSLCSAHSEEERRSASRLACRGRHTATLQVTLAATEVTEVSASPPSVGPGVATFPVTLSSSQGALVPLQEGRRPPAAGPRMLQCAAKGSHRFPTPGPGPVYWCSSRSSVWRTAPPAGPLWHPQPLPQTAACPAAASPAPPGGREDTTTVGLPPGGQLQQCSSGEEVGSVPSVPGPPAELLPPSAQLHLWNTEKKK